MPGVICFVTVLPYCSASACEAILLGKEKGHSCNLKLLSCHPPLQRKIGEANMELIPAIFVLFVQDVYFQNFAETFVG